MKKWLCSFKVILLLIMMAMLISVNSASVYAGNEDFTVEVKYGFDNNIQVGCYVPVYVTVTNNGKNFEGAVQIIVPGSYYNTMYGKELSIASGDTRTIVLTAPFKVNAQKFTVRIVNKNDKVVWKDYVKMSVLKSLSTVNIGILSDDFSALSYMADREFMTYSKIKTKIYELSQDKLPEDYNALDMLDVIVISNYSTDKLTEGQLEAINRWVNDGGFLLLGSGSTVKKTFSGLNGRVFEATIGEYNTYSTKFGLEGLMDRISINNNYEYDYRDDYFNSVSPTEQASIYELLDKYDELWKNEYYENVFYTFYEENEDYIETVFKTVFYNEYYGATSSAKEWEDYTKNDFYYFVYDLFARLVELRAKKVQIEENVALAGSMDYVKADILNLRLKGQGYNFYGEIENSNDKYTLVSSVSVGDGMVAVAGFDFTQNPFAAYAGNKYFFTDVIETLIGEKLWEKVNNYDGYYYGYNYNDEYYYVRNLFEKVNNAELPPMLMYIIIIGLYLIAGFVIYLVFRRKKKNMLFWPVQAGLALVFAFMVYIAGFTTRKISPELNTAVINELSAGKISMTAVGKLFMPKKKTYEVAFSKDYMVSLYYDEGYGYNLNGRDYDSYYIAENITIDAYEYEVNNTEALGDVGFKITSTGEPALNDVDIKLRIHPDVKAAELEKTINSERGYIVEAPTGTLVAPAGSSATVTIDKVTGGYNPTVDYIDYALMGTVVNNYGVTLEDAIIFYNGYFYLLGDIRAGESVDVAKEADVISNHSYRYNMNYIFGEKTYGLNEFLFGSTASEHSDSMKRAFYQYINNAVVNASYNANGRKDAFFFAFPAECSTRLLANENITENAYEMVCKWIDVEDVEQIAVGKGENGNAYNK